jgi:hypothetical protein
MFVYPAAVTITSDRAAYLELCWALTAFNSEGYLFYVPTPAMSRGLCSERPVILASKYPALANEQSLRISVNVLGLNWLVWAGLERTTRRSQALPLSLSHRDQSMQYIYKLFIRFSMKHLLTRQHILKISGPLHPMGRRDVTNADLHKSSLHSCSYTVRRPLLRFYIS